MRVGVCGAWMVLIAVGIARADIDPVSGIDFVTVGAPNNRGYDGPDPLGRVAGRGAVNYTYGIGRFEITTGQWLEYVNAFRARPDAVSTQDIGIPLFWGAQTDPTYSGPGTRYRLRSVDQAAMLPAGGISWRQAAMYVNWLNHDKDPALASRMTGAYDASTFGYSSPGVFTDQRAHTPGARYWIPTLDEWIKAVHYDPNATGPNGGQGRWWQQPNGTDTPLIYGPPVTFGGDGTGQANSSFALPMFGEWTIPLGAYPTVTSPWGLLDAAGATSEWNETVLQDGAEMYRILDGSSARFPSEGADRVWDSGLDFPDSDLYTFSFRVATSIPAPSSLTVVFGCASVFLRRKRRVDTNATSEVLFCSSGARVRRAREGPDG